jgi:N,N'-diacetyllegionaminate synthase
VRGIRFIETALAHPVDKDRMAEQLADLKQLFGKSIVTARSLPAGHVLVAGDLAYKKPGSGLPAARRDHVVGRRLRRAVEPDHFLIEEDFE